MISSEFKDHSPFAPSAAKRWLVCPGSVTLEATQPNESSVYAQWGSAAHQLSEMRLKRVLTATALTNTIGKKIREIAPMLDPKENDFLDVVVDDEMIEVVQKYVIYCESLLPEGVSTLSPKCAIEAKIQYANHPLAKGTNDFSFADWPMVLHVVDLKGGAGVQVDALENPQLACYGLGALRKFGSDFETIRMSIFQPRGEGATLRTWEIAVPEFVRKWGLKFEKAIARAEKETDTFVPGDHCQWCRGASVCPKAKATYGALVKTAKAPLAPPSDPKLIAKILKTEVVVLEYLNQIKVEAFRLLNQGIPVPGFKLVQTWGRTKWANESEVVRELTKLGLPTMDIYAEMKTRTPAQIRKKLGKRYPAKLDEMTTTPNLGAKLVPETDKRPAFLPAAEAFKDGDTD